jgi:pSer/pThr/pTyr-binding forkhead associated (FHA) protein
MDVRFVIRSPSGKRRNGVVPLPVLVGRGDEAKIRIPQDSVSRRHCEFVERDGHVWIRDLGSTNGTLLEGKRIQPNVDTPVSSGGTVSVGDVHIRVEYAMPRSGDDDRTILLKRLPDADADEPTAAGHPQVIELGAAADETQSDAGEPLEMEAAETTAFEPAADAEPPAVAGDESADLEVESVERDADDFAFLSAADSAGPIAEPSAAATAGDGQQEDLQVESAEPDADDFAFLSAAAATDPPAAVSQPAPAEKPAQKPRAAGKPAAAKLPPPASQSPGKPAAKASPPAAAKPAPEVPAKPPAAADGDGFGFLAAAPESPEEELPAWPTGAEEPAPVDDDDLNDFFKSLS